MGSSVDPVLRILVVARRRLTAAALADALAPPAAGFLLVSAAVLAIARWTGREDLPGGLLAAAAVLAMLAAFARVARGVPGFSEAALHLDRALGAEERFSTVLETAESDPAVAEWAARGALARAAGGELREALRFRPPAALLPLLLAGTLVAGLGLLPAEAPAAAAAAASGTSVAVPSAAGGGVRGAAHSPAAVSGGVRESLAALEAKASAAGNGKALEAIAAARAALARGDEAGADGAMGRALAALGISPAAGAGSTVPGATGGGQAAAGASAPAASDPGFRPLPVPLRAREAVRRYFRTGE